MQQLVQQIEQGFDELFKALPPYPKAKAQIENLVKPVTIFLQMVIDRKTVACDFRLLSPGFGSMRNEVGQQVPAKHPARKEIKSHDAADVTEGRSDSGSKDPQRRDQGDV